MKATMLEERNVFTGCAWMRTELGLKGAEFITYAVIWSYTQYSKEGTYSEGEDFLAEWAGVDKRTIQRYIASFKERGIISVEYNLFNKSVYKTLGRQNVASVRQNVAPSDDKMSGLNNSNTNSILNNILNNSTTTKSACVREEPINPSLIKVQGRIKERGLQDEVDAEAVAKLYQWLTDATLIEWTDRKIREVKKVGVVSAVDLVIDFYKDDFRVRERCTKRERMEALRHYQSWLLKYLKDYDVRRDQDSQSGVEGFTPLAKGVLPE